MDPLSRRVPGFGLQLVRALHGAVGQRGRFMVALDFTNTQPTMPKKTINGFRGIDLLRNPILNKGTAFTGEERDALGLRGLLPPGVSSPSEQTDRELASLRGLSSDLERYIMLMDLLDRNETLFYRLVLENLEEMMPLIYTPTVGQACLSYADIFRRPRGIFVSKRDRGRVSRLLENWPEDDVKVIVFTDGERILGLGDLGANGIGIPIGKLMLYTACAGIAPSACLPVMIDVGTNNERLRDAPFYLGLRQERTRGEDYDGLVNEFIEAAAARWPGVLLQFEDFANANAFRLLQQYRDSFCCFNDDIQGTASVALSGILSSLRITGRKLADQRLLFQGAGEAGLGIAELMTSALMEEGVDEKSARECCWFVDSKGLVVKGRDHLNAHKQPFAHESAPAPDLETAVGMLRPTGIIGVSGQQGAFTRSIIEKMADFNERPIVFALSNPTSKAECTAEEAYRFSHGRAVFTSGSPFRPVTLGETTFVPGQGNNAYIFPGVGLGILAVGSSRVTDSMFLAASRALADEVTEDDLAKGRVYPSFTRIREVSVAIAVAVAKEAMAEGLAASAVAEEDLVEHAAGLMYKPEYPDYY